MTYYATDGSINVTVVTGSAWTGIQAVDGSLNVVKATSGSYVGTQHPCGALWVTPDPDALVPRYAPDGSMYVNTTLAKDGSQPVTVVSGSFGPSTPGAFMVWAFV